MHRFANRWIVVTETDSLAHGPRFKYRSYAVKADACNAVNKLMKSSRDNVWWLNAYVVDRDNMGSTILP
jgi:hypothetical protein